VERYKVSSTWFELRLFSAIAATLISEYYFVQCQSVGANL